MEGMVGSLPFVSHGIRRGESRVGADQMSNSSMRINHSRAWSRKHVQMVQIRRSSGPQINRETRAKGALSDDLPTNNTHIPIFPLSVVALPGALTPLNIFEARYRLLFNTIMHGKEEVDDELVDKTSPYCGTRTFGMCYVNQRGEMSLTGCTLEVENFARRPDGTMGVICRGKDRFLVKEIIKDKPLLICEVDWINDEDEGVVFNAVKEVADRVAELVRSAIQLGHKVRGMQQPREPEEISTLPPHPFSFWVASLLDNPQEQQAILENTRLSKRLEREEELLQSTVNYLSAAAAIQDASKPDGSSSPSEA